MASRQDVKTETARLEAQLRHLTLPTQRGYRKVVERRLASLRPRHIELSELDLAIIEALRHPSERLFGHKGKQIAPWLYAAAHPMDSKRADWARWFVTGPTDRRGYIKGPFPLEQVERIAATGRLQSVCLDDDGRPMAYELRDE